jgi:hypothetical protein
MFISVPVDQTSVTDTVYDLEFRKVRYTLTKYPIVDKSKSVLIGSVICSSIFMLKSINISCLLQTLLILSSTIGYWLVSS